MSPSSTNRLRFSVFLAAGLALISVSLPLLFTDAAAEEPAVEKQASKPATTTNFEKQIRPLLKTYCRRCHNADEMTSGIRVDHLDGSLADKQLFLWKDILKQVSGGVMPPEGEPQPKPAERKRLADWIRRSLVEAKSRVVAKNGSVRRLTVAQYRNTLSDLLKLDDDFTDVLPPDTGTRDGFANDSDSMLLSPLLLEAYFDIAEKSLDACIVDVDKKPVIQTFRMELGKSINKEPCPDKLILGAKSLLLDNADFIVTQPRPVKPFPFTSFAMRTKYRFNEGYQGNATVRGWRDYDSIYHAVFACMRGTDGYPRGLAYETVPEGLLLRPAIPSAEIWQQSSTYGPKANFKISLRELPDHGRFRVTVNAARGPAMLLLDPHAERRTTDESLEVTSEQFAKDSPATIKVPQTGVYQCDVYGKIDRKPNMLFVDLGGRQVTSRFAASRRNDEERGNAFLLTRLPAGELKVTARFKDGTTPSRIVLTRVADSIDTATRYERFAKRTPILGVHVGLRRDCGSTFARVGDPEPVATNTLRDYVFEGAIRNFPSPDGDADNDNYLAGVREVGVRSEYTDGRERPRLLIRSVEFEGPYYEQWPPRTHRNIFIDFERTTDRPAYARHIIRNFATRAFRRPVTESEAQAFFTVWQQSFNTSQNFQRSIKDALLVVLTSPQFLFLIESSDTPKAEPLDSYELASKLSYFLWNSAPDERLLLSAKSGDLHQSLDAEVDRLIADPRFQHFSEEFASQWLSLDKLDVVETDSKRFPKLTRDTKTELRREPVQFLQHVIRQNLPLRTLVQSDFLVANEVVANYYGLGDRTESGFRFVAIPHEEPHLGGVLSQAGILAGLSNGRESHPIKRGAWLARKIIAEPPDDPPPNVPALPEDDGADLTLRQKLERHRNQMGCAKCHEGIDPWGIPFEQFDAGGLWKAEKIDARSTLPDQTNVEDFTALKKYLAEDRLDRVAYSVLKHLTSYAIGRSLRYNEIEFLKEKSLELKLRGYRMRDLVHFVVRSPMFLEK